MPTDLFDLAAKITADTSQHDRALTESQKKVLALAKEHQALDSKSTSAFKNIGQAATGTSGTVSTLSAAFKNLSSGVAAMDGPMGGTAGRLRALSSLGSQLSSSLSEVAGSSAEAGAGMAGMAGPIGIAVVGIAATIAAAGVLTKSLFDLAVSTAEFQGKMQDLSQQTGVSVETLSALEVVAKTTGGSIETITASLGIFQKHLEEAQDPTSKIALSLKELGVQTENTEQALRQSLSALSKMPEGYKQTALALELFGRGGKSLLAILKETDGDLDGTMAKFREMGILISTEDAKAADEFNDQLALLGFQVRAAGASIVKDAIPAFKGMVDTAQKNRESLMLLASTVGELSVLITGPLAGALNAVVLPMKGAIGVADALRNAFNGVSDAAFGAANMMLSVTGGAGGNGTNASADVEPQLGAGLRPDSGKNRGLFRDVVTGGRGGGGGRKAATPKDELAPFKAILDQVNRALDFYGEKTEHAKVMQEFLRAGIEKLNPVLKAQADIMRQVALVEADTIDTKNTIAKAEADEKRMAEQHADMVSRLRGELEGEQRALKELTQGQETNAESAQRVIDAWILEASAVGGVTKEVAELIRQFKAAATARDAFLADVANAEAVLGKLGGMKPEDLGSDPALERMERQMQEQRERLHQLAGDISSTLTNSIRDGFEHGVAAGFKSMLLGFTQILARMAEEWLASSIFKMLSNVGSGSGGSGGSWWKTLLGIGTAGLGGGLGGGGGSPANGIPWSPPPLAMGMDFVPFDNFPALLHKGERVMTAAENRNGGGGGHTFQFNISTPDARSFMGWETQSQIKAKLKNALANDHRN